MESSDRAGLTPVMSNSDTTLVLGATGKSGRRVAARLRLRGVPVRTASRSSATRFDWSDRDTWDPALAGVGAVYLVPPAVPGPVHGFVERAAAAGVRRLVLLSGHGIDSWGDTPFGEDMRSAEAAVRASGLEWTILRASNFQQNFDEDLWHAPLLDGGLALPLGDVAEPFVDLDDVADVAAAVLTEPDGHAGRTYELTGPRPLTFAEAVEQISLASGRALTYARTGPDEYTASLVAQGLDPADARTVTQMYAVMDRGVVSGTSDDVAAVLGRAPRPFEDYVLRTAVAGAWDR